MDIKAFCHKKIIYNTSLRVDTDSDDEEKADATAALCSFRVLFSQTRASVVLLRDISMLFDLRIG